MPRAKTQKVKKIPAYAAETIAAHAEGLPAKEAAEKFGISLMALYARWTRLELPPIPPPKVVTERDQAIIALRKTGMSYAAIGRKFNLTGTRIKQIIERGR